MPSPEILEKYETVIGLEVHVQLNTKSKAFCGDNAAYGGAPNSHISAISLGHPGTLPQLNEAQLVKAIQLGLALGSTINPTNYFDRKNYFYTDLPKGYQITQDRMPIATGGGISIQVKGEERFIRLHHIHMEEDAGKSIHDIEPKHSLVDLNRAGVPLVEIVTEPDLRSAEETQIFMNAIRQLVRYLDVSDGNMEEGSMRCDCNISVRLKGATTYGQRCEVKNVNSMRFAAKAINYEVQRQIERIEAGGTISQQTLKFDPVSGKTFPLRDKEDAHDYRYFPEPDLPPIVLDKTFIKELESSIHPLPKALFEHFTKELGLSASDAQVLTEEKSTAIYFQTLAEQIPNRKELSNLLINKLLPSAKAAQQSLAEYPISGKNIATFIELIESEKVSKSIAYQRLFPAMLEQPEIAPMQLAEQLNLLQSGDEDFLEQLINEVIEKNQDKVDAYRKGKKNLMGFFMGEVMRNSKGKANPKATTALLQKKLMSD